MTTSLRRPALRRRAQPLLNRATQGFIRRARPLNRLFLPPLEGGLVTSGTRWDDGGSIVIDSYVVQNAGGRASADCHPLRLALCRTSFLSAWPSHLVRPSACRAMRWVSVISLGLRFPTGQGGSAVCSPRCSWQQRASGRGCLVTPLEMALVTSVIANGVTGFILTL